MRFEEAKRIITKTFENEFDEINYYSFLKNLLKDFEEKTFSYQGNLIPEAFRPYIKKLKRIGKYNDGKHKIDLLIVYMHKSSSIEKARATQRNFIGWYLKGSRGKNFKNAALVAFVSPQKEQWRFSLVKINYIYKDGKIVEELSHAKRWSYLVGKNEKSHTAQSRFVSILQDENKTPSLEELIEAFDVEKVSKDFFNKYRDLLIKTVDALDKVIKKDKTIEKNFKENEVNSVDFAKKLLGQIVFLYFLQKKGWFGVSKNAEWGTGPKDFLRKLFNKEYCDYQNFFNDILEPLFYEALSRPRDDDFYSRFNCKIPFLNGGLFEPINSYDWVKTDITLPNELFSNPNKTDDGFIGDGILDIFDRYNFTVNEDEPLEKEVAIDPELLGKLYEKFNAIRPDNFYEYKEALLSGKQQLEKKFNKKFGVYYTPREIVHYMCQQSLIAYLDSEFQEKIPKEDIEKLFKYGEEVAENESVVTNKGKETQRYKHKIPKTIRNNAYFIDEKLKNIKICDPAVGSGAFPVGMMHEIVKTRKILSIFIKNTNRTTYKFKRECIENSLYGVDIDPGAIEITKLRLWLSLVVDEDDIKNIKPLPNLDYKIMQGNSLISKFMGIDFDIEEKEPKDILEQNKDKEIEHLIEKFNQRKLEFLNQPDKEKKKSLKDEIENTVIQIFEEKLKSQKKFLFEELKRIRDNFERLQNNTQTEEFVKKEKEKLYKKLGFDVEQSEKQLKEFTKGKKVRPFFPWKLYFAEVFQQKGGFDVVIANPPYVKEDVNKKAFNGLKNSECYQGKMDLWYLFGCMGLDILKNDGIICLIATNNWISNDGASKFRNKIISFAKIIDFIDFGNYKVFSAGIQTMILIAIKNSKDTKYTLNYGRLNKDNIDSEILSNFLNAPFHVLTSNFEKHIVQFNRKNYINSYISFVPQKTNDILNKIKSNSNFYLEDNEIFSGIDITQDFVTKKHLEKLGDNFVIGEGIFVLNNDEKNNKKWNNAETKLIKPYYTTKEINRYRAIKSNKYWIIYTGQEINKKIDEFPNIKEHLDKFQKVITSVNRPYGLHRPRNEKIFLGEKILSIRKCVRPSFAFVDFPCYVSRAFLIIKSTRINLKYLLAILNSNVIAFWLFYKGKRQGNQYQIDKVPLKKVPIKNISWNNQSQFINLTNKILSLTQSDDYLENPQKQAKVKEYEQEIDKLVYQLYGLTDEEIRIIEKDIPR